MRITVIVLAFILIGCGQDETTEQPSHSTDAPYSFVEAERILGIHGLDSASFVRGYFIGVGTRHVELVDYKHANDVLYNRIQFLKRFASVRDTFVDEPGQGWSLILGTVARGGVTEPDVITPAPHWETE